MYEAREGPSKTFSWVAMITSFILTSVSTISASAYLFSYWTNVPSYPSVLCKSHIGIGIDFQTSQIILSTSSAIIFYLPGFFLPNYGRSTPVAGYVFLMTVVFNWLYVIATTHSGYIVLCSLTQSEILFSFALASASPTATTAANILPFLLGTMSIVNGIIVPHIQMTNPWRDFVYWANPLVSGISPLSQAGITNNYLPLNSIWFDIRLVSIHRTWDCN